MTQELTVLALAALLQIAQMGIASMLFTRQHGAAYNVSPRDQALPVTGLAARADRAYRNHFEGLAFFTIAVVVLVLSDKTSGLTAGLAWAYLIARVLYVPAYIYGLSPWRSFIWMVGLFSTLAMLLIALLF